MKKNKKNKVRANGSISTTTYFKKEVGEIRVTITVERNVLRSMATYRFDAMVRKPKHQYFINLCKGCCTNDDNKEILKYISLDELYLSMHNHWVSLCPLPKLGHSQYNSKKHNFKVLGIPVDYESDLNSLGTSTMDKINWRENYD